MKILRFPSLLPVEAKNERGPYWWCCSLRIKNTEEDGFVINIVEESRGRDDKHTIVTECHLVTSH